MGEEEGGEAEGVRECCLVEYGMVYLCMPLAVCGYLDLVFGIVLRFLYVFLFYTRYLAN